MTMQARTGPASIFAAYAMSQALADHWWIVLLRGLAAIAFAVAAFAWPGLTLLMFVLLWGAYAFVDGVLAIWAGLSGRSASLNSRWWLMAIGVAGVAAGVFAFGWPAVFAVGLLYAVAAWAIFTGLMHVWGGFRLRKEISGEWLLILTGLVLAGFGVFMIARPVVGGLTVIWTLGALELLAGLSLVALSLRLRKHKHKHTHG